MEKIYTGRFLALMVGVILLAGCSGAGNLQTSMGSVERQDTFEMTAAYEAYYLAIMEQQRPVEVVRVELDDQGRVTAFTVNQAPHFQEIQVPQKSYSPGWTTANKFVDGLWGVARFAVPGAAAWATADAIGKIAARPNVTNSYNSAGNDYAGGDSTTGSYNPTTDNSNQGNPIDNSNQNNPIDNSDNSNQGNPVDNSNQPIDNSNQNNPIDNSNQNNPIDNTSTQGEEQ